MLDTLRPLFASLSSHGVEYLVIGGVAVIAHGVPRLTLDVDILIRPTYDNAVNLLRAFEEAGLGSEDISSQSIGCWLTHLKCRLREQTADLKYGAAQK